MKGKRFYHSYWDRFRILADIAHDGLDPEIEHYPMQAAEGTRNQHRSLTAMETLAGRVIEQAYKDAKRGSRSALAYFRDRDYAGHAILAGISDSAMERIREAALDPTVKLPETERGHRARPKEPREGASLKPIKGVQHDEVIALADTGMRRKAIAVALDLTCRQVDYALDVVRKRARFAS